MLYSDRPAVKTIQLDQSYNEAKINYLLNPKSQQ